MPSSAEGLNRNAEENDEDEEARRLENRDDV